MFDRRAAHYRRHIGESRQSALIRLVQRECLWRGRVCGDGQGAEPAAARERAEGLQPLGEV